MMPGGRPQTSACLIVRVPVIVRSSNFMVSTVSRLDPPLAEHVVPVYVEATPEGTEVRILQGLEQCRVGGDLDLVATFGALREDNGLPADKKLVLFIDQFEQWLHAHRGQEDTPLVWWCCAIATAVKCSAWCWSATIFGCRSR